MTGRVAADGAAEQPDALPLPLADTQDEGGNHYYVAERLQPSGGLEGRQK